MKKYLILFIIVFSANTFFAQSPNPAAVVGVITDEFWTQRMLPAQTYNANPVSGTSLFGGTWGPVEIKNDYLSDCQIIGNYEKPGNIITVHDDTPCNFTNTTTFFQRRFFIPIDFYDICDAFIDVRADDAFRVYVNGFNIPSAPGVLQGTGCGSNPGGNTAIIAMNFKKVYRVPIPIDYLFANTVNSVIVEVQNCGAQTPDLSYVTALIMVRRNLQTAEANFKHLVVPVGNNGSDVTFSPATSSISEKTRGIQTIHWKIEMSASETGPFTTIHDKAGTNSELTLTLKNCFYYRVTRTITNGCSTVSFSKIIKFCDTDPPGMTGDIVWEQTDPGVYATKGEGETVPNMETIRDRALEMNSNEETGPTIRIYPNPASDLINIEHDAQQLNLTVFNLFGQTVYTKEMNGSTTIDISEIMTNGIYLFRFSDALTSKVLETRKVIIQR
jgi:hypothetical protein